MEFSLPALFTPAEFIGYVAVVVSWMVPQFKKRRHILYAAILTNSIFVIHFLMINSATGAFLFFLAMVRNILFLQKEHYTWANKKEILATFLALPFIFLFIKYEGIGSYLGVLASMFMTLSDWQMETAYVRLFRLLARVFYILFTLWVFSVAGLVFNISTLCITLIAMYRLDRGYWKRTLAQRVKTP